MEMMKMMTMMGGRVFVPASQFHLIFPTPVSVCVCVIHCVCVQPNQNDDDYGDW